MRLPLYLRHWYAVVVVLGVLASGCGPSNERQVEVYAASSLAEPFEAIATAFETAHPEVRVTIVAAGSPTLVRQLIEGAPGDVLATANQITMDRAVAADVAHDPQPFATNEAIVVTTAELANTSLDQLDSLVLAVCDPTVPCGAAAVEIFNNLGISLKPTTLESSVRGVLTKLSLGEVDAAVIYRSDLLTGDGFAPLVVAQDVSAAVTYPIALTQPGSSDDAAQFVAFVLSDQAQSILHDYGFGSP